MRTEGNEGIAPLRFLGLLLFQKSALGGPNWAGGGPQESERRSAPEESFSGVAARGKSEKLWFDPYPLPLPLPSATSALFVEHLLGLF